MKHFFASLYIIMIDILIFVSGAYGINYLTQLVEDGNFLWSMIIGVIGIVVINTIYLVDFLVKPLE